MVWSWGFFPHFVFFFFIFLKIFNWRIIALQCCVGFCNTIQQPESAISIHISPPSCMSPPSLPLHPTPLGCHRALGWAPCVIQQFLLAFYFTYVNVYVSMLLSQFVPPSPSSVVSTNLFFIYMYPFFILLYASFFIGKKKQLLKNSILELVKQ